MVDVDKIKQLVEHHFEYTGRILVDANTGKVSGTASVNLKKDVLVHTLPVQFATVYGHFNCDQNNLTTLKGAPTETGLYFSCRNNPLVSLEGLPAKVGALCWATWSPHLPLLRLLNLNSLKLLEAPNEVEHIITKYKGQGKPGAIKAAAELVRAGYRDNARW